MTGTFLPSTSGHLISIPEEALCVHTYRQQIHTTLDVLDGKDTPASPSFDGRKAHFGSWADLGSDSTANGSLSHRSFCIRYLYMHPVKTPTLCSGVTAIKEPYLDDKVSFCL